MKSLYRLVETLECFQDVEPELLRPIMIVSDECVKMEVGLGREYTQDLIHEVMRRTIGIFKKHNLKTVEDFWRIA